MGDVGGGNLANCCKDHGRRHRPYVEFACFAYQPVVKTTGPHEAIMKRTICYAVNMQRTDQTYRAYLLRLWREDTQTPWRVTLADTRTGEERHFASVDLLVQHFDQNKETSSCNDCS